MNVKTEIANSLNYKFNAELNIIFGSTDGYTSLITPFDQYETGYNIAFCVSKDGSVLNKSEFADLKKENKVFSNIIVNKYRVIFTIKGSMKQADKLNNVLEANKIIVNFFKENNYQNIDEYKNEFAETCICNVKGQAQFITTRSLEELRNIDSNDSVIKKEENVVRGIIGGILGSLVGVLAIVVIGQMGYIAAISGIAMGACTIWGYNKLSGVTSKKGIIISIIIIAIMTYIGVRLNYAIAINNELSKFAKPDFMKIFSSIPDVVKLEPQIQAAYMRDIVLTYVFTALGAFGIIKAKILEINNKNVFEIL
ncbi:MAG: hypothetical protein J5881_01385 [Clostridia bacterium]|nr:hypothetical protein [Clostridia bacterium]